MSIKIALLGAAGKMGTRISRSLKDEPAYEVLYVEGNEQGEESIRSRGDQPSPRADAVAAADVVIMAVPDRLIPAIASEAVLGMRSGAMLVCLDPAAPHAGVIPCGPISRSSSVTPLTRPYSMKRRTWKRGSTFSVRARRSPLSVR